MGLAPELLPPGGRESFPAATPAVAVARSLAVNPVGRSVAAFRSTPTQSASRSVHLSGYPARARVPPAFTHDLDSVPTADRVVVLGTGGVSQVPLPVVGKPRRSTSPPLCCGRECRA